MFLNRINKLTPTPIVNYLINRIPQNMFLATAHTSPSPLKLSKMSLLPKEIMDEFRAFFPQVVHQMSILPELHDLTETNERIAAILKYNVPHGKLIRSQMLIAVSQFLSNGSNSHSRQINALGWALEMNHAFACISDDIMDKSFTRRGRPCWHQLDNLGTKALIDGFLLENLVYRFLEINLKDEPYFLELMNLFHKVTVQSACGQMYDHNRSLKKVTMKTYNIKMKFKTGYYTFFTPFATSLIVHGLNDPKLLKQVEDVTLDIGYYFSVQDDYLDCFVDEKYTGKKGTDIADGEFTWPLVAALGKANDKQRKIIFENYGHNDEDMIERVKEIYFELGIPEMYKQFEVKGQHKLYRTINQLPDFLPRHLLENVVNVLIGRIK